MKYNGIPDRFRYRVGFRVTPIQQQETRILNVKGKVKGVSLRVSKAINYIKYNNFIQHYKTHYITVMNTI